MNKEYEIVTGLTLEEADDLAEFLGSRMDSSALIRVVQEKSESTKTLYRGINFRKKDLKIGFIYSHWNELSSWSKNKDVAIKFALDKYIPEGLIEDICVELGYKPDQAKEEAIYNEVCDEIVKVVFCLPNGYGFNVSRYLNHKRFSKEEEVICFEGQWEITSITPRIKDEKTYFEVELNVANVAVV